MSASRKPITLEEIIASFTHVGETLKMEAIKEGVLKSRGYSIEGYKDKYSFDQTIQAKVQHHAKGGYGYNGKSIFEQDGLGHYKLLDNPSQQFIKKPDELISELAQVQPLIDIEETRRTLREINCINRNKSFVAGLKTLYNNQCQMCGIKLQIGNHLSYSEVHHIRPLGQPHNGPDTTDNMMVVCPNCHVQLDFAAMTLTTSSITCKHPHCIDIAHIDYHNNNRK